MSYRLRLSMETADWPKNEEGWSISPGTEWCPKGYLVRIGALCTAGAGFKVGNMFEVGNRFAVGDYFTAGRHFKAGDSFMAGDYFHVGDLFLAGNNFKAGRWFTAGDRFRAADDLMAWDYATGIACIGYADGYWKYLLAVDGVAYIGSGCRWFTLRNAIKHWSRHPEDRRATLALMESAKALAKLHHLKFE